MSAGQHLIRPRCLHPVRLHAKPGRTDEDPVCYRPLGHRSARHLSRWAYMRELGRANRKRNTRRRQRQGPAA